MKDNSSGTSFMNASYIRGPNGAPKKFIVTQAPQSGRHAAQGKGRTIDTLWSMIYDHKCPAVVMIEGSQPYVPQGQPGTKVQHHNLSVTLVKFEKKSAWNVTTCQVTHANGGPPHMVKHFNFLGWPRDGVPTSTAPIMQMMCDVMEITESQPGPLVVQDLCGTGKAGTYIAIEHAFHACDEKQHVDIAQIVSRLREDRAGLVMTPDEYQFIHKVVTMYSLELSSGPAAPSYVAPPSFNGPSDAGGFMNVVQMNNV
jgi:protein tyrosine phosphatase